MSLQPRPSDLSIDRLRSLWLANRDPDIRRALEEVAFRRAAAERQDLALREITTLFEIIRQAWKENVGGQLVAMEMLRAALNDQRDLRGNFRGIASEIKKDNDSYYLLIFANYSYLKTVPVRPPIGPSCR